MGESKLRGHIKPLVRDLDHLRSDAIFTLKFPSVPNYLSKNIFFNQAMDASVVLFMQLYVLNADPVFFL